MLGQIDSGGANDHNHWNIMDKTRARKHRAHGKRSKRRLLRRRKSMARAEANIHHDPLEKTAKKSFA
jgi:hypothetical protein